MPTKAKSLPITKLKIATVGDEGTEERRVSFVASTATEDRDYEVVDIKTFRLPLKGGGEIVVGDIPAEGVENVDIPFLTNHDLYHVESTIGSVRKATFEDGKLIFEVGISSLPSAQEKLKLIEEGHLDNAFSIQYSDYTHDAAKNTDVGGEILEVSLVARGANKDAQVLAVKSLETEGDGEEATEEEPEPTKEEGEGKSEEATEPNTEGTEDEEETETEEPEDGEEEEQEQEAEPTEGEAEEGGEEMTEPTAQAKAAAAQVKQPSQEATAAKTTTNDYLKSKGAVLEFAKMSKAVHGDPAQLQANWKAHLASKGIEVNGGGSFYPTEVEQVIFKAWHDVIGPLATFRRTQAKASRFYAMTTESTALGHKKGEQKADQDITAIPRNAGLKVVYKRLPIDWIDIVNDDTGELYVFRERELYDRVQHAIVRGAIMGDGLSAPTGSNPDYRIFDGTNGLYPMAADITGSGTSGSYASTVATQIANVSTDGLYDKIVKTLQEVKVTTGQSKVLVLPEGALGTLLLTKNDNGGYLFQPGTDFRNVFGVSEIVELDPADFTRVKLDVIAYRVGAYTLGGPDTTVRNWFDGDKNLDYMMVEQPVYGSLEGYKAAAGYAAASE